MDSPRPLALHGHHHLASPNHRHGTKYNLTSPSPTAETNSPCPRSTLTQLAHRIFPGIFAVFALAMLSTILIFALTLHQPMPRKVGIGMAGAFAIITLLLVGSNWLVYARRRHGWWGWDDEERSSRSGSPRQRQYIPRKIRSKLIKRGHVMSELWRETYTANEGATKARPVANQTPRDSGGSEGPKDGQHRSGGPTVSAKSCPSLSHLGSPAVQNKVHLQPRGGSNVSFEDTLITSHPLAEEVRGSLGVSGGRSHSWSSIIASPSIEFESALLKQLNVCQSQPMYAKPRSNYEAQRPAFKEPNWKDSRNTDVLPRTTNNSQRRPGFQVPRNQIDSIVSINPSINGLGPRTRVNEAETFQYLNDSSSRSNGKPKEIVSSKETKLSRPINVVQGERQWAANASKERLRGAASKSHAVEIPEAAHERDLAIARSGKRPERPSFVPEDFYLPRNLNDPEFEEVKADAEDRESARNNIRVGKKYESLQTHPTVTLSSVEACRLSLRDLGSPLRASTMIENLRDVGI